MYQSALALRRAFKLGAGSLEWNVDRGADVVAFTNGEVTVVANMGNVAIPLPFNQELPFNQKLPFNQELPFSEVLMASGDSTD